MIETGKRLARWQFVLHERLLSGAILINLITIRCSTLLFYHHHHHRRHLREVPLLINANSLIFILISFS